MNRTRLIELLSSPEKLNEGTLEALKEALDAYPFFQAGRMLWIKNLHKLDHIRYNSELKLAAAFIPDRSRLFFLINDLFAPLSAPDGENPEDSQNSGVSEKSDVVSGSVSNATQAKPADETDSLNRQGGQVGKDDFSGDETDLMTGSEANYFDVNDAIASATGELIDFSALKEDETTEKTNETDENNNEENVILPSAELLDYEKESYASTYSIENEVTSENEDFNRPRSFSEWLRLLRQTVPVSEEKADDDQRQHPSEEKSQSGGKMDLIDNFLNNSGDQRRIVSSDNGDEEGMPNEDIAAPFTEENEDLMTETLADMHIQQKRYRKAIEIFERLRLKYPEKNVYFARRIKEMEELINNQ